MIKMSDFSIILIVDISNETNVYSWVVIVDIT